MKISKEIAKQELFDFLAPYYRHLRVKPALEEIEEGYHNVIEAICNGRLVFENGVPKYTLEDPIKSEDGSVIVDVITFKTRIKPSDKANLAKGIDLSKDQANYALKLTQHILNLPSKNYLDIISENRSDYAVLETLAPVFM